MMDEPKAREVLQRRLRRFSNSSVLQGRYKNTSAFQTSPITISPSPHPPTGSGFTAAQTSQPLGGLVVPPFMLPINYGTPIYPLGTSSAPPASYMFPFGNQVELPSQYIQQCHSQLFLMVPCKFLLYAFGSPLLQAPTQASFFPQQFDDRKRKKGGFRPKVVPERGSFPCEAQSRKNPGQKCRNACLMEYVGSSRPKFCAEHIDQDQESIYAKCHFIGNSAVTSN